ncbi:MAG: MerR family DNA-binding transcriptional regulator [Actinobacteria bacterium]|nr:MerR family DNA-binding transcriptional regulator [Actinomycetota bacterium]
MRFRSVSSSSSSFPDRGSRGLGEQGERDHLSIGEVLSLLKDDFPEVTISKIRFLESQGLLDPERTPSGYRKFYEPDVERLRWILQQQRENFLPLKVIRGRLGAEQVESPADDQPPVEGSSSEPVEPAQPSAGPELTEPEPSAGRTVRRRTPVRESPAVSLLPPPRPQGEENMTFEELCEFAGLSPERLRELERFGLLSARSVAGGTYYDSEAIAMARIASAFETHGVEPRHLKMYKSTAEREITLFEQVVTPLLKQRNPRSRRQAAQTLTELVNLAHELRALLMRQAVEDLGLD